MSTTDDYAAAFVRLADTLADAGHVEQGHTYEDVIEGYHDAPPREGLYRYAYLYWHDDDAPPTVEPYWSLDSVERQAHEDVYRRGSRWPVCILDLQDEVAYNVNVRVTFDRSLSTPEVTA